MNCLRGLALPGVIVKNRLKKWVTHWIIMQVIVSQSSTGRKRTRLLIGLWLGVLGIIFVMLTADLYVSINNVQHSYTIYNSVYKTLTPAR